MKPRRTSSGAALWSLVHVKPQNHNARGEQWLWSSLGFIRKLSEEKKSVFGFLICFFKKNSGST